jgi:hypothetical protein
MSLFVDATNTRLPMPMSVLWPRTCGRVKPWLARFRSDAGQKVVSYSAPGSSLLDITPFHRIHVLHVYFFPVSKSSTPVLTMPIAAPVWIASLPPPLNRYSMSANPDIQVTMTCDGTSLFTSSSLTEVRISARARPFMILRLFTVLKHCVMSWVDSNVSSMNLMSEGCGAAMQS